MPLACCSGLVVAATLVALLILPAQYMVPEFGNVELTPDAGEVLPAPAPEAAPATKPPQAWRDLDLLALDLLFTAALVTLALVVYLCEYVQRKIMETRIVKLNQYLGTAVERLRARDAEQDRLEATLRLVQAAAAEYHLLLYLLLRRHRRLATTTPVKDEKEAKPADDELGFLRSPSLAAGAGALLL